MALTLRVMSFQSQALGAQSAKTFGSQGGSIGRSQNNDWVLPDPEKFVSGHHADIVCRNGAYYLRDVSTNGTFINGSPQPIGNGMEQSLTEGDRLQIGEYDISVSLDQADLSVVTGPTGFDLGSGRAPSWTGGSTGASRPAGATGPSRPGGAGAWGAGATGPTGPRGLGIQDPGQSSSIDPLDFFADSSQPASRPATDPGVMPDHASALEQFYQPPPVAPRPAPPPDDLHADDGPAGIPEDWDMTGFAPSRGAGGSHGPSPSPGAGGSHGPSPSPGGRPLQGGAYGVPAGARNADGFAPMHGPAAQPDPRMTSPAGSPPSGEQAGALVAMLAAAGLDPASARAAAASPELVGTLGALLGVVVQGMLEVLKARSEVKTQFRVPVTMMRPVENNPLKFSANAAQALQNLLVAQNQAYLGPVDAFAEGFHDLKAHQMAMIAGMRAAFDSLIERFDPDELAERFEKRLKRGSLLNLPGKGRYWDMYRDLYEELTQDADVNFQRLFGEKFARAYEEQMRRLTMVRR